MMVVGGTVPFHKSFGHALRHHDVEFPGCFLTCVEVKNGIGGTRVHCHASIQLVTRDVRVGLRFVSSQADQC